MIEDATIADRLRHTLGELPPAEKRVARTLLADYPAAGLGTIANVAEHAGSSGPTVLRLATRLGFSGFAELQRGLRDELTARDRSPLVLYDFQPEADDVPAIIAGALAQEVDRSLRSVDRVDFAKAINMFRQEKLRVFASGGRFSGLLAEYLTLHLQQLRPGVRTVAADDRPAALLDIGRRDVVVLFDFRRYQTDVIRFGLAAAARGAQLILITDPWLSPLAAKSAVVLTAEVSSPSPFDSLVPAMALVEGLIAGTVRALGDVPRARIETYDNYWAEQHVPLGSSQPD